MQQPPPPEPPPPPRPPQQRPWGYEPPQPPQPPRPWYRQPLGVFAIITTALLAVGLLANALDGGGRGPPPATTAAPGAFAPPATATTTTTTVPATLADRLRQAAQGQLAAIGTVTAVDAEPGGQVTVTWEIVEGATTGQTRIRARQGVMRIMAAVKQVEAGAGDDYQSVLLLGRFRLPGSAEPATVVRLRFSKSTVQRTEFLDMNYIQAYQLADAAVINPAFRG
ncbi:MAG TPA: hypothetical protein VFU54_04905 [Actinomycetota bacterium]|nr:hypothetical protein [Actinomycetota bacterium]